MRPHSPQSSRNLAHANVNIVPVPAAPPERLLIRQYWPSMLELAFASSTALMAIGVAANTLCAATGEKDGVDADPAPASVGRADAAQWPGLSPS